MVKHPTFHNKAQNRQRGLDYRARLMRRGESFRSVAAKFGVSDVLVWKIAHCIRPARRGKSAEVRAYLEAAS